MEIILETCLCGFNGGDEIEVYTDLQEAITFVTYLEDHGDATIRSLKVDGKEVTAEEFLGRVA